MKGSRDYKQIALKRETYKRLTNAGSKGQSYDQIVSWLLDLWMERFAENVGKLNIQSDLKQIDNVMRKAGRRLVEK